MVILSLFFNEFILQLTTSPFLIFAAKVRRLYDIANILGSLKMIKKVYVHENRGRKPAFEWIGLNPDIEDMKPGRRIKTCGVAVKY